MLKILEQKDAVAVSVTASLRILATTDLHMHILPYDYLSDQPVEGWGLTNTARLIREARAEVENTLLLDNGDFLHGTAMGDLVVEQYRAADTGGLPAIHPMIAAMDHLGYDAGNIGNHDFDRGVDVLLTAVEQARFPIVSSNTITKRADSPTRDATLVPPFAILNRDIRDENGDIRLIRIGVVGFLPPGSLNFGARVGEQPETRDIVEAAEAFVPHIRALGADIVVALAHSGIGGCAHVDGMENALIPLSHVAGIDAIVGGHSHQVYPISGETQQALNGVPTVVPGFWGSHLGVVDLKLTHDGKSWSVRSDRASLRKVQGVEHSQPAPQRTRRQVGANFPTWFESLHRDTLAHMRTPIARCTQDLENYLALVGADRATRLVQQAMIAHASRHQSDVLGTQLPVLASSAPFKSGGLAGPGYYTHVQTGEMTMRSLSDLYVFPNELALMTVTGAFLMDWLERSASVFNQVGPGERAVSLKEDSTPGYLLESVLGLTYQIDLSQPARFTPAGSIAGLGRGRIMNLRHQGVPVTADRQFILATSDFRAQGGGGYPVAAENCRVDMPNASIRGVLKGYLSSKPSVEVDNRPIWTFADVSGASVAFKSSPRAVDVCNAYPWLSVTQARAGGADGFALYHMELRDLHRGFCPHI
ncbi:bifunctional 2',3'-cyclic-nucleotide 2'-phosphodiesterase/3'-nucleotidase [Aliiroseovarius sp. 2305UL8-7]|uniref:bifunctional 2',3'-cyclic-nucleotide 2'-phosphodiesterase/3'-nucleotidase n=1 Tax=Aliiroseovarius conchicola TaxID=3121637 RepID=UPI0035289B76